MKYYKEELLEAAFYGLGDPTKREIAKAARKQWEENVKQYLSEFQDYKNYFPKRFVKTYEKHAFHDYIIRSIQFYKNGKRKWAHDVCLQLESYDHKKLHYITYQGVVRFSTNMNFQETPWDSVIWLYSELLPVSDSLYSHEFLLCPDVTLKIIFHKLKYRMSSI